MAGYGRELAVSVGYASSNLSPTHGANLAVGYAHPFLRRWSWLIRPEVVFNLERPDGQSLKGGGVGLDGGVGWASAPEGLRLVAEATVGARLMTWPGIGAVSRLGVGVGLPLAGPLSLVIGASGELGMGRVGDERPRNQALLRGDVWIRTGYRF